MKKITAIVTLSLIVLTSMSALGQVQKRRSQKVRPGSKRSPMAKIRVGRSNDYFDSSFVAQRVRRLENVMNVMQDRILDLEYQLSYSDNGGGYGGGYNRGFYCSIKDSWNGRMHSGEAKSKLQAISRAHTNCVRNATGGAYYCSERNAKCERL